MSDVYRYTITTSSRVSAARAGEMLHHAPAHRIIPGGTVRGALAALWWRDAASRGWGSAEFTRLFDHHLRVGQAVPIDDGRRGRGDTTLSSASTYVCKYQREPACRGFEVDLALELLTAEQDINADPECPYCNRGHGPTRDRPGWVDGFRSTRTTRTQLEPDGTAKEGNLFDREAIPAGLTLVGLLWVSPGTEMDWADGESVRIGGKRSVMGSCTITLETVVDEMQSLKDATRVALRLRSPAIVVDQFGAGSLAEEDLLAELRRVSEVDELELVRSWLRSEQVTGWHMRSALPKPSEWALSAGSTVVVEGLTDDGWSRLRTGIGMRTLEGFGEIEIIGTRDMSSRIEAAVEGLVVAFTQGRHQEHQGLLRNAHAALAAVRKERMRSYGHPELIAQRQRKERWFTQLDQNAKEKLNSLFDGDLLNDEQFLTKLDAAINKRNRREGR